MDVFFHYVFIIEILLSGAKPQQSWHQISYCSFEYSEFDDMAGAKTFSLVGSGISKCNSIAVDAVCVIPVSKHIMGKKHWRIFKELQNQMLLMLTSVKV